MVRFSVHDGPSSSRDHKQPLVSTFVTIVRASLGFAWGKGHFRELQMGAFERDPKFAFEQKAGMFHIFSSIWFFQKRALFSTDSTEFGPTGEYLPLKHVSSIARPPGFVFGDLRPRNQQ